MIKAPRKRSGRPSVAPGDRSVSMTVRVPVTQYDVLCKQATAARCSLAEHVRRLLTRRAYFES